MIDLGWVHSVYEAYQVQKPSTKPGAQSRLEKTTKQLRVIATRSHLEVKARPGCFPDIQTTQAQAIPMFKLYDAVLSMAPSRTRPAMSEAYDNVKDQTSWQSLYTAHAVILAEASRSAPDTPPHSMVRLSLQPADACAAVGCESLDVPQTVCADCKKVFYCGRECQRRSVYFFLSFFLALSF